MATRPCPPCRTIRSGRRVVVVEAELQVEKQLVARAIGLLLRASQEPDDGLRQQDPLISPLDEAVDAGLPPRPLHHANCIELRRAAKGAYWVRAPLPLLPGFALEPAERAAIAADWANPAANFGGHDIGFINPDITLYLHRPPQGEWLGVGPASRNSSDGLAISDCPLVDRGGVVGRCLAAGLAAGYSTKAPGR